MLVCDAMLGSLARWLRLLGYDCTYLAAAEDRALVDLARDEGRVLLTRDRELAARADPALLICATGLEEQLVEVCTGLGLRPRPGLEQSRCSVCNGRLRLLPEAEARAAAPSHVVVEQGLRRCTGCGRLYWYATHAERIVERMLRICARIDAARAADGFRAGRPIGTMAADEQ
jgi:hypothetical protein